MTLRSRLTVAFLAIVLGPIMVSSLLVAVTVTSATRNREVERLNAAADAVAISINALCQRARAAAEALAATTESPVPAASSGASKKSRAPAAIVDRGLADAARLEDGNGRIIAEAGAIPQTVRDAPWTDCTSQLAASAPMIGASVELRQSDGKLIGKAQAVFVVDADMALRLASAAGVGVTILDGDTPVASSLTDAHAHSVALDAATGGRQRIREQHVRLLEPAAGQPLRAALSNDQETLAGLYAVLALVVALVAGLAVVVARYLARSLTRPLAEVAQAAEVVASGNLSVRVPVRGRDEVGRLASTFNGMTRDLASYVAALTASRDQLRGNLALLGDTLSSTYDLDRIMEVILEIVTAATGAQAGLVLLVDEADMLVGRRGHNMVFADRGVEVEQVRLALGEGLLGAVAVSGAARRGRIASSGVGMSGERLSAIEPRCHTYIAVPFFSPRPVPTGDESDDPNSGQPTGHLLGVLVLYDRLGSDDFDDGDLVTLRTFAGQAAVAVENVLLHRQFDRLTGVEPAASGGEYTAGRD